jgi:hypothetical protein
MANAGRRTPGVGFVSEIAVFGGSQMDTPLSKIRSANAKSWLNQCSRTPSLAGTHSSVTWLWKHGPARTAVRQLDDR